MSTIHTVAVPDPSPTLRVTIDVEAPCLTVKLEGEIDLACADLLHAITQVEMVDISEVVIDLSELDFTDTSGLRALLKVRESHLVEARTVRFVEPRPLVRRVFELVGCGELLAA